MHLIQNKKSLAPVVLFTYDRPNHTRKTVEALSKNYGAIDTDLYIFSDAPVDGQEVDEVEEVRRYIRSINGFKSINIIEREKNFGLSKNIIDGVTSIVVKHGKIIVLEDDILTSKYFLKFMNDALDFYENEKKVWHISGWNYPIEVTGLQDTFLWRTMNCWGWATWEDRWKYFEKDVDKLVESFGPDEIYRFNLDGTNDFWGQVLQNKRGKINTWAIFWYATIFQRKGLCLNPSTSYVKNIGFDGTGVHCNSSNEMLSSPLNKAEKVHFESITKENDKAVERIKSYYRGRKRALPVRLVNKISRYIIGDNLIK